MFRRTLPIAVGIVCAGIARAEIAPELVEMLARPEVPASARTELEAGGAPVWVLERDTSAEQISVVGVIEVSGSAERVSMNFFERDSLLEADLLEASGTFSEPAVLGDVAKYQRCPIQGGRARIVEFVAAYQNQKEGRAALGRYLDKPDARSVPEATGMLLDQLKAAVLVETVRTHLRDYPSTRVSSCSVSTRTPGTANGPTHSTGSTALRRRSRQHSAPNAPQ